MSTRKRTTVNNHPEIEHETEAEPMPEQLDEVTNSDAVGKIATIAVIGVGAALISAELIPGMLIGLAAAFVPGLGPKLRPMIKSTIRAGYAAVHKTREMVAEASEQMQDVVAEARSEHAAHESEKDTAAHA
jgi:Protein of unknown function (DUF5132)